MRNALAAREIVEALRRTSRVDLCYLEAKLAGIEYDALRLHDQPNSLTEILDDSDRRNSTSRGRNSTYRAATRAWELGLREVTSPWKLRDVWRRERRPLPFHVLGKFKLPVSEEDMGELPAILDSSNSSGTEEVDDTSGQSTLEELRARIISANSYIFETPSQDG